jgi:hypothetical protein
LCFTANSYSIRRGKFREYIQDGTYTSDNSFNFTLCWIMYCVLYITTTVSVHMFCCFYAPTTGRTEICPCSTIMLSVWRLGNVMWNSKNVTAGAIKVFKNRYHHVNILCTYRYFDTQLLNQQRNDPWLCKNNTFKLVLHVTRKSSKVIVIKL